VALQLTLPLGTSAGKEDPLRQAWRRSGLTLPYEMAQRDQAIAICLRCMAEAMRRTHKGKRRG